MHFIFFLLISFDVYILCVPMKDILGFFFLSVLKGNSLCWFGCEVAFFFYEMGFLEFYNSLYPPPLSLLPRQAGLMQQFVTQKLTELKILFLYWKFVFLTAALVPWFFLFFILQLEEWMQIEHAESKLFKTIFLSELRL